MPWNDNLVGVHLQIASYPGSPLRVVAGPGTGKTFALIRRIARLLEGYVAPNAILAVTFTRTAAIDLVNKLAQLGAPGAAQVPARTLHSLCFSLLSENGVFQLTHRHARPLLSHETKMLVQDLAADFGGKKGTRRLIRAFEAHWATLQSQQPGWPIDPIEQQFDVALRQWLTFHEAILLGELVPIALRFIQDNPASPLAPAFEHVLADEYQDLNRADQSLLDALARNGAMTIIGDPDQSIYRFRLANPGAMAAFSIGHPGTHDETLAECRRCPQRVVAIATALVATNPRPVPPVLTPRPQNAIGDIAIVQHSTLQAEADAIAAFIDWYLVQHAEVPPGEILVLTSRRRIGYLVRDRLNAAAVQGVRLWAARSFFFEESLDELEAQEGFTLLTLLVRPNDRVALRTWVGLDSPSARVGGWARIRNHAAGAGLSPREVLEALESGQLILPHTSDVVARFHVLGQKIATLAGLTGQQLVDALFPAGVDECADIRLVATAAALQYPLPAALLEEIRTVITQPEIPGDQGQIVRVMSLHKSKGLTARVVVVAGCVAGAIPTIERNITPAEALLQLEEQRRLFYVAITRATETLVLSGAAQMPYGDAMQIGVRIAPGPPGIANLIASPFLQELGAQRPATETGAAWRARVGF